jgi:hypothetical protein
MVRGEGGGAVENPDDFSHSLHMHVPCLACAVATP